MSVPAICTFFRLISIYIQNILTIYLPLTCFHLGELTLVAIGPLTNIATAHKLDADFLKNLKELYIMGGNTTGKTQLYAIN